MSLEEILRASHELVGSILVISTTMTSSSASPRASCGWGVIMDALFDPLFLTPFVDGLLLSVVLALLGPYSRMRGEWLASLGVAQAAGAGLLFGAFLDGAATIGALVAAAVAAVAKTLLGGDRATTATP